MDRNATDAIADLLRLTGPRPAVPADCAARVKAAVRAEWRAATASRSAASRTAATAATAGRDTGATVPRRTAVRLAAIAAALVAAVAIPLLRGWRPFPGAGAAARVEIGSAALRAGDALAPGTLLETRESD